MKHVDAGLSAREDRESGLNPCCLPVRLVRNSLCAGMTL